jgi:hypothetical protein
MLTIVHLESSEDSTLMRSETVGEVKARKHSKYGHDFVTLHITPQNFLFYL